MDPQAQVSTCFQQHLAVGEQIDESIVKLTIMRLGGT